MFVEIHVLQNFALSNLNRDDTGAPKDCDFGGYRRARISSQCIKRSIRTYFKEHSLLSPENLAVRTRYLVQELGKRMSQIGKAEAQAVQVARAAMATISLMVKDKDRSEYLLFVGQGEIAALSEVCLKHWDQLLQVSQASGAETQSEVASTDDSRRRKAKKSKDSTELKQVADDLLACLDGGQAADLALFGRMIADKPDKNVDAACQVAHAISTNRVSVEFDFYTAVDDIPHYDPEAGQGAGMMDTVQFNSSCYYRYANLDMEQLVSNLKGNGNLARSAVKAFLEASILAIPTGKQTGTAAQNPPSLALVVVRKNGLWSLANAFAKPVRPDDEGDLVQNSVKALVEYWGRLERVYGSDGIRYKGAVCLEDTALGSLSPVSNMAALVDQVVAHLAAEVA